MRVLLQRVKSASVTVSEKVTGQIEQGLLLFLGVHQKDNPEKIPWLIQKIVHLRIFPDEHYKMNKSLLDVDGEALVVSQFTLYGDATSGRRPEFTAAALPEIAFLLYEEFIAELSRELKKPIASGVFGAKMDVALVNDGPVTLLLEK